MPAAWSKKDERMYEHIVKSCSRSKKVCKRIAAATVNKQRGKEGRALGNLGSDNKTLNIVSTLGVLALVGFSIYRQQKANAAAVVAAEASKEAAIAAAKAAERAALLNAALAK